MIEKMLEIYISPDDYEYFMGKKLESEEEFHEFCQNFLTELNYIREDLLQKAAKRCLE